MNRRGLLGGILVIVCLAVLWRGSGQRSELASLRADHQQLLAQVTARADGTASPAEAETGAGPGTPPPTLVATPELLRLRNDVTRLTQRRRELAGERAENELLRAQIAARGTNGPGGFQLPPGYMRRSEARMMGYNKPDDTLQSLLWAVQNHDLTNLLQAFTPERAEQLRAQAGESAQSTEDFFSKAAGPVAMRILGMKQDTNDGSIAVEVEVVPGEAIPPITFRQINGQWKIAGPF